jgi:hypothetical protein
VTSGECTTIEGKCGSYFARVRIPHIQFLVFRWRYGTPSSPLYATSRAYVAPQIFHREDFVAQLT